MKINKYKLDHTTAYGWEYLRFTFISFKTHCRFYRAWCWFIHLTFYDLSKFYGVQLQIFGFQIGVKIPKN